MKKLTITLAFIAVFVVGVGIGLSLSALRDGNKTITAITNPDADAIVVTMNEWSYQPNVITVVAGTTNKLVVRNQGKIDHAFVIAEAGVDTGRIPPGKQEVVLLEAPWQAGLYNISSSIPGQTKNGMSGRLSVEENPALNVVPDPNDIQ